MGFKGANVSLTVCDDAAIRALNRAHRSLDRATDVLSFPQERMKDGGFLTVSPAVALWIQNPGEHRLELGDVVISSESARRQAERFGVGYDTEMARLLIHGILHLLGWDHLTAGDRRRMRNLENRILAGVMRRHSEGDRE